MSDHSTNSTSGGGTNSNRSSKDYSVTNATTVTQNEHEDNQTVAESTTSGHPPSNPDTPAFTMTEASTIGSGDDEPSQLGSNNASSNWGIQLVINRIEPFAPGLASHASRQNLRSIDEEQGREETADQDVGGNGEVGEDDVVTKEK